MNAWFSVGFAAMSWKRKTWNVVQSENALKKVSVDVKMWVSSNNSNTQENDGVVDDTMLNIEDSDLNVSKC